MVTIMTTIKKKRCFWLTFFASTQKRWRQQLLQWLVQLLPWQWWHWEGDQMSLAHRHFTFWNLLMKIRIGKWSNTNIVYSSTNKLIISQNKTSSIIFLETFTVSLPSRCKRAKRWCPGWTRNRRSLRLFILVMIHCACLAIWGIV